MNKIILKIALITSLLINNTAQSYALRPAALKNSPKPFTINASSQDGKHRQILEKLSHIRYKDRVISIEETQKGLLLVPTKYCDGRCRICFARTIPILKNKPKDTAFYLSDKDVEEVVAFINRPGNDMQNITITGGGEPFTEFKNLIYLIKKAKARVITLKTNGLWAKDFETVSNYFRQITEAAEENRHLHYVNILISADPHHNNINETLTLLENYLLHKDKQNLDIVGEKLRLNIACVADKNFKDYFLSFWTNISGRGMDFQLITPKDSGTPFLGIVRESEAFVYWIPTLPVPIEKAYSLYDEMLVVWESYYDFSMFVIKALKLKTPFYGAVLFKNPTVDIEKFESAGFTYGDILEINYDGSVTIACTETNLFVMGNVYMPIQELVDNANNNPFIRALKEKRMKEVLEAVENIRPALVKKIPFGCTDADIMEWLVEQDEELAGYILDAILKKDFMDNRLTDESAVALGLKSSSSGAVMEETRNLQEAVATLIDKAQGDALKLREISFDLAVLLLSDKGPYVGWRIDADIINGIHHLRRYYKNTLKVYGEALVIASRVKPELKSFFKPRIHEAGDTYNDYQRNQNKLAGFYRNEEFAIEFVRVFGKEHKYDEAWYIDSQFAILDSIDGIDFKTRQVLDDTIDGLSRQLSESEQLSPLVRIRLENLIDSLRQRGIVTGETYNDVLIKEFDRSRKKRPDKTALFKTMRSIKERGHIDIDLDYGGEYIDIVGEIEATSDSYQVLIKEALGDSRINYREEGLDYKDMPRPQKRPSIILYAQTEDGSFVLIHPNRVRKVLENENGFKAYVMLEDDSNIYPIKQIERRGRLSGLEHLLTKTPAKMPLVAEFNVYERISRQEIVDYLYYLKDLLMSEEISKEEWPLLLEQVRRNLALVSEKLGSIRVRRGIKNTLIAMKVMQAVLELTVHKEPLRYWLENIFGNKKNPSQSVKQHIIYTAIGAGA